MLSASICSMSDNHFALKAKRGDTFVERDKNDNESYVTKVGKMLINKY